jgi:hypothetical protein
MDQHQFDCPCPQCVVQREAMAFAAIREIHLQGSIPLEWFNPDIRPPFAARPLACTDKERGADLHDLAVRAELLARVADTLPRKRGAKIKHTDRDLLDILLSVDLLHKKTPGKSDRYLIEDCLRRSYREQGKRESRVMSREVQASIKSILNLICLARKRFRKPRQS